MIGAHTSQLRLQQAIEDLDEHWVRVTLSTGADPNALDANGFPPVMAAFEQKMPAHEKALRDQQEPITELTMDRVIAALFEGGARGDATRTHEGLTEYGVVWQMETELARFGIYSRMSEQDDGMAAVARVRRWYDHGADPQDACFRVDGQMDPMDAVDWLEWQAYCWANDDNAEISTAVETFVHHVLVMLVEKGLPVERLLGDSTRPRPHHLDDMGPGLMAAVTEAQRRQAEAAAAERVAKTPDLVTETTVARARPRP